MTKEYDNRNSGALFKNDKQGNEKRPDYNGSINVDGRDYWISAWLKEGQKGKFMSLSVKPKDAQPGGHPDRFHNQRGSTPDLGDDIPFAPEFR